MTQRKMLQITAGALLLLLPWFGGLASGELSNSKFVTCPNFFYNRIPPQGFGNRYQTICQRYKNQYHFATLYDRDNRTPLYSAYLIGSSEEQRDPNPTWMYEPQLASKTGNREMQPFPNEVNNNVIESQAVLADYVGSIYSQGHLAPFQHLKTEEDGNASFTLTNIVPQRLDSNSGPWSDLETEVLNRFENHCKGKMYVITGTIPFQPVRKLRERVSKPEYIWSAYCCPSLKPNIPENEKHHFPTYAAVGRNDPDSGEDIVRKDPTPYAVRRMSLKDLEKILEKRLSMKVSLFDGNCPVSNP